MNSTPPPPKTAARSVDVVNMSQTDRPAHRPPQRARPEPLRTGTGHRANPAETCPAEDSAEPPVIYTPAEAAVVLAVPESWLRRQAGQRAIPCTRIGRHVRFSAADLHAIVAPARPSGPSTAPRPGARSKRRAR